MSHWIPPGYTGKDLKKRMATKRWDKSQSFIPNPIPLQKEITSPIQRNKNGEIIKYRHFILAWVLTLIMTPIVIFTFNHYFKFFDNSLFLNNKEKVTIIKLDELLESAESNYRNGQYDFAQSILINAKKEYDSIEIDRLLSSVLIKQCETTNRFCDDAEKYQNYIQNSYVH